jgi:AAA family ATP:ADP antiporter
MSDVSSVFMRFTLRLGRFVKVKSGEGRALIWAFTYFFALMCSYYIVRPMRDEMGVAGGVENLQWLFTGTFAVMLLAVPAFGWLTARFRRSQFLPVVYLFFIVNLLLFFALFQSGMTQVLIARAFFIWSSVFNLFVVSVFWSLMTDLFNDEQARRLFSAIAAGGTMGAIAGPSLTSSLAIVLGTDILLLISAAFLGLAVVCIWQLERWGRDYHADATKALNPSVQTPIGGSVWGGIRLILGSSYLLGIALLMLLFTTLSTFLYFQQAQILADSFTDSAERTAVFAGIDLAVNILTLALQLLFTGRLIKWLGLSWTLALIPMLLCLGFLALALMPVLAVIVLVQVIRRAGNYAISRPAREMLYVVLDRESKYKAKNVNDTVMYRGGDAVSAWLYAALRGLGLSLSHIALIAVPLAALWAWLAYRLGDKQTELSKKLSG